MKEIASESKFALDTAGSAEAVLLTQWNERIHVRVSSADTSGLIAIMHYTSPPKWGGARHVHDFTDEVLELRSGLIAVWLPDRALVLRPGETVTLPHGVPHAWRALGEEAPEMIVTTNGKNLEMFFREMAERQLAPNDMASVIEAAGRRGIRYFGEPLSDEETAEIVATAREQLSF